MTRPIALLFFAVLFFAACEKEENPKSVALGSPFSLAIGESQDIASSEHRVSLKENAIIEDSRCPSNVLCVWAGRIIVQLTVEQEDTTNDLQLTIGGMGVISSESRDTLNGFIYEFLSATPYPGDDDSFEPIPLEDYKLEFRVTEE